jgi:hypothetical protein
MKESRPLVNESKKKRTGRPRSVSAEDLAPAVAVRLPTAVLAQVDDWAAKIGMTRSDAIRDMVTYAIAGHMVDSGKKPRPKR